MTPDSLYIKQVQSSSAYDYLSEIPVITEGDSGMQMPAQNSDWLRQLLESDITQVLAWVICGLIVVGLVWMMIKKFELADEDVKPAAGMGTDTIYGHDWEREIQRCMTDGQYGEAVVLCYLRCLAEMQRRGVIEFHQSKTPGMYLQEIESSFKADTSGDAQSQGVDTSADGAPVGHSTQPPSASDVEKARVLTNQYLRVRYGHKPVDRTTAERMIAL